PAESPLHAKLLPNGKHALPAKTPCLRKWRATRLRFEHGIEHLEFDTARKQISFSSLPHSGVILRGLLAFIWHISSRQMPRKSRSCRTHARSLPKTVAEVHLVEYGAVRATCGFAFAKGNVSTQKAGFPLGQTGHRQERRGSRVCRPERHAPNRFAADDPRVGRPSRAAMDRRRAQTDGLDEARVPPSRRRTYGDIPR